MIKPITDPQEYASKYSLDIDEVSCKNCGIKQLRDIPFATKGYRGLMTKEHECGKMFINSIAVPVKESLDNIRQILFIGE